MPRYSHLHFVNEANSARYTATRGHSKEFHLPDRDRASHAAHLIRALKSAQTQRATFPQAIGNGFYQSPGFTLAFESDPNFPLAFESLDLQGSKIQLLSVTTDSQNRTIATVHVPDDKVQILLRKLEKYRDTSPDARRPHDNRKLAESISNIKLATLYELWTDAKQLYPAANTEIAWEVWLRRPENEEESPSSIFRDAAIDFGLEVISDDLIFIDRTVLLVRGTREQLSRNAEVLGLIAEVRKAKITADLYSTLESAQQHVLADTIIARLGPLNINAPAVGLLDTGVNRAHPLLESFIKSTDIHALKEAWGTHDSHISGHGTQMAGLAIYGDLAEILSSEGPIEATHGVQSLKLIHAPDPHRPDLYGQVTIEGVSRLEIDASRRRNYCLAITADARDMGRPSSWSAAIDNLAFGTINDTPRLFLISAGNTEPGNRAFYPADNESSSVQDPAQAWNAIAVGGYTDRVLINGEQNPGFTPLAIEGDLAPSSTTSMTWPPEMKKPFKPDIVLEAGNMGVPPGGGTPDFLPELHLLTTNSKFSLGAAPFVDFHDTSAATALASQLATKLVARYPDFTPETVRGLMIHSAYWTDAMRTRARDENGKLDTNRLLRTFGYGTPDPELLFYSAQNNLTLIAEDAIQPFFSPQGSSEVKTCDINLHALPWPRDALLALPLDIEIRMRVTLSYFIEPSPGERGWDRKYGYPSHGLRFNVIRPTETLDQFKLRINAHDRDEDYDEDHAEEPGVWDLGSFKRSNGSIHSDTWQGTAAELANRGYIAVHPTMGWWRTRRKEKRFERKVRYSLIVSILTPDVEVDIYTPVAVSVGIEVPVPISI
ncbi:S8 family peptidase [Bradyrhizobium liaoningense]|uniref:S8 family peptidase n=1 Tax=Bradyrhizobium liaoningense TaxID=43992 RepID=UPI001BA719FD|nr:S8 family peptidase [Bradyrhizobium liaoningense]MBR0711879.1 S8 family peptidase [Bradyrhizobium liaoningense]